MDEETLYSPEFNSLFVLLEEMSRKNSLDGALDSLGAWTNVRPHITGIGVWLYDAKADRLRLRRLETADPGLRRKAAEWKTLTSSAPLLGQALMRAQPLRASENPGDLELPAWAERMGLVAISFNPLIYSGDVLGVLVMFFRRMVSDTAWTVGRKWMRILTAQLAARIVSEKSLQELKQLQQQLLDDNSYLREEIQRIVLSEKIVGQSTALQRVLDQVRMVSGTATSVLIHGESGTGKELVARAIHNMGERQSRPLVTVNCAAVPDHLFESEFFGHVKGAFTHAITDRAGRFELAHQGTLFLDEVAELPQELQGKLLRAIQEGTYERVGENLTRHANVRIIAATNHDLEEGVRQKRFRDDLYYRLSVFPIYIPPLRERREDIEPLAEYFVDKIAKRLRIHRPRLTRRHIQQLTAYDWPGNVRELQNVLERALIVSRAGSFMLPDLGDTTVESAAERQPEAARLRILTDDELKAMQRESMQAAIKACGGKIQGDGGAAERMGIPPSTFRSRMKVLGISS